MRANQVFEPFVDEVWHEWDGDGGFFGVGKVEFDTMFLELDVGFCWGGGAER